MTYFDCKVIPSHFKPSKKEGIKLTPEELKYFSKEFRKSHQKWLTKVWGIAS